MPVFDSEGEYPRKDNIYKNKHSFNFDMMRTRVFVKRDEAGLARWVWLAHMILGVITGFTAFCMAFIEDHLIHWKTDLV